MPLAGHSAIPSVRKYFDKVVTFTDPRGDQHCFVEGLIRDDEIPDDSDWGLVRRGCVALSLMVAQPTAAPWIGGTW